MPNKRVRPHVNPFSITHEVSFDGFGNDKPVIVDVGACKGVFCEQLVKIIPDHNFILFEIRKPVYKKLCDRFAKYDNVMVFDGDAGRNFRSVMQPCMDQEAVIKEVYINFPDPWFKERHKKRRFVNAKWLQNIGEWISPETKFVFQTDQKQLFEETVEVIEEHGGFEIEYFDRSPYGVQTHWERQKMAEGDEIYRMKFWRK